MKKIILLTAILILSGCARVWQAHQVEDFLDNCENNKGIHSIRTYNNSSMYTVRCNDGARFEYLKVKPMKEIK